MTDGGSGQRPPPDFRTLVEDAKALATVLAMEAESVLGRRPTRFLGILALVFVVGGTFLFLLDWYIDPGKAGQRKDLILTLAQILGGTALLAGLYFAWRSQQNAQNQLEIARRGQITERFTQAIDQLGATDEGKKSLEIRLGAIYSLARTARDSESDHWPVMEVLTAYVRLHAPRNLEEERQNGVQPPKLDIQAILTVLSHRSKYHHRKGLEYGPIDLHDTNLSLTDLSLSTPEDPSLQGANLQGANLQGANLQRAKLQSANLQRANLSEAHLEGAHLEEARLGGAKLQGAHLVDAHLERAFMDSSILMDPSILVSEEMEVKGPAVHLEDAILVGAHLEGASLFDARLENANLSKACLERADLREAHLEGATLDETSLEGARLDGTHLEWADLRRAQRLTQEQVDVAIGNPSTTLPNGLQVPPEWEKKPESEGFDE